MFDIFEHLPQSAWFERPANEFTEVEICHTSGFLRGRFCDEIDTVAVLPAALRSESCPFHTQVMLTADERFRLTADCADENSVQRVWFVLPPAQEYFYRRQHSDYRALPPFQKGCGGSASPMQFIYPQENNATVALPRQMGGEQGKITFELAHARRNAVVFWHIDSEYIASTTDFHTLTLPLSAGNHSITVVDDEGNMVSINVNVK
jgi:penicillin-binding protein 1C